VTEVVSTLAFAWTQLKPELLQLVHGLALKTSPATAGIAPPFDPPIHDIVTGAQVRPSEMQEHLLSRVIPVLLLAVQSIAEDALNDHFGTTSKISKRIRDAVRTGHINSFTADRAHHWRLTRNVIAHGDGMISSQTEAEVVGLLAKDEIKFSEFVFWGPTLDAGYGGVSVPITDAAVRDPGNPGSAAIRTPIKAGRAIAIGLGDLLAAGYVWSDVMKAVCGK
jgi:hypothetical protein